MQYPIFALTSLWFVLLGLQVTSLKINLQKNFPRAHSHAFSLDYRAEQKKTSVECTCKGALFIDFSPGAMGGESLDQFFKDNNFTTVFFHHSGKRLMDIIQDDLAAQKHHLPQLQQIVAEAAINNSCGNVFLGDLKTSSLMPFQQAMRSLDGAFPNATWIWLIRHPAAWATSLSHWTTIENSDMADLHLQRVRRSFLDFHCYVRQYFGKRVIGNDMNLKKLVYDMNVVQLNLEKLDWPLFTTQLQEVSGYQCLQPGRGMPHVGHHEPTWTYWTWWDQVNWDSWDFLTQNCESAASTSFVRKGNEIIDVDVENPFS